jgi:alcohol dehydrogenase (cytochrome c)
MSTWKNASGTPITLGASTAPALIETKSGKKLLSVAPKDGHLYGFDLATNTLLYRVPATRIENVDATFGDAQPL